MQIFQIFIEQKNPIVQKSNGQDPGFCFKKKKKKEIVRFEYSPAHRRIKNNDSHISGKRFSGSVTPFRPVPQPKV